MAAVRLGKGPAAKHHHLELFIMTRLTELSGAAAGSPAERWAQRSADVASLVQTARTLRAQFIADHTRRALAASGRWSGLNTLVRSEEHTSELQSLMRTSYAVFCLKKNKTNKHYVQQ